MKLRIPMLLVCNVMIQQQANALNAQVIVLFRTMACNVYVILVFILIFFDLKLN